MGHVKFYKGKRKKRVSIQRKHVKRRTKNTSEQATECEKSIENPPSLINKELSNNNNNDNQLPDVHDHIGKDGESTAESISNNNNSTFLRSEDEERSIEVPRHERHDSTHNNYSLIQPNSLITHHCSNTSNTPLSLMKHHIGLKENLHLTSSPVKELRTTSLLLDEHFNELDMSPIIFNAEVSVKEKVNKSNSRLVIVNKSERKTHLSNKKKRKRITMPVKRKRTPHNENKNSIQKSLKLSGTSPRSPSKRRRNKSVTQTLKKWSETNQSLVQCTQSSEPLPPFALQRLPNNDNDDGSIFPSQPASLQSNCIPLCVLVHNSYNDNTH